MGKKKRVLKGISSLIMQVDEHIEALYKAYDRGDRYLVRYYLGEIQSNFIDEIEKKRKRIRISHDIEKDILSCYARYNEVKSLSWNQS